MSDVITKKKKNPIYRFTAEQKKKKKDSKRSVRSLFFVLTPIERPFSTMLFFICTLSGLLIKWEIKWLLHFHPSVYGGCSSHQISSVSVNNTKCYIWKWGEGEWTALSIVMLGPLTYEVYPRNAYWLKDKKIHPLKKKKSINNLILSVYSLWRTRSCYSEYKDKSRHVLVDTILNMMCID